MTDGAVLESVGGYGASALRRYPVGATHVNGYAPLPPAMFGEGICEVGGQLWQLTWRERVALRWNAGSLDFLGTVPFNREGWGICNAGDLVLTSDGSSELVTRDPKTLRPREIIRVRLDGRRVTGLNDLAWAEATGQVWANVFGKPYLVAIDPDSGEVTDVVDARAIWERHRGDPDAVLNGLAPLAEPGEFLLTGKRWRYLYHIRLAAGRSRSFSARMLTDLAITGRSGRSA